MVYPNKPWWFLHRIMALGSVREAKVEVLGRCVQANRPHMKAVTAFLPYSDSLDLLHKMLPAM